MFIALFKDSITTTFVCMQDEDLEEENFVTARNTMLHTAVGGSGTMISAEGAADDTITDLGTLVIVGEPDDVEEMDTMKSKCHTPQNVIVCYRACITVFNLVMCVYIVYTCKCHCVCIVSGHMTLFVPEGV